MKVRITIFLIALFIIGIAMTISGVSDLIKMSGNVPDFNYDSMQNIKKGSFVQGYIWNIDGCYANTITEEKTIGITTDSYISDEYFLMPLINDTDYEKELYITVVASDKADRDLLYAISDATWEYYNGNEDVVFPDMSIVAKVSRLGDEYQGYLVEAMLESEYYATEAEVRQHIVPYALNIYKPKSAYTSLGIGLLIVAVFVAVGIVFYIKFKKENAPEAFIPADNSDVGFAKPSAADGFAETYTPPQPVPIPNIPQPADADEFFSRTPKPAQAVAQQPAPEAPAPVEAAAQAAETTVGDMDGLDTTGLFSDSDYEDSEFIE